MANKEKLEYKAELSKQIAEKIHNSQSVILVNYQGLNVAQLSELRNELKKSNSEFKVYKNSYTKRALESLKINLDDFLEGPNALVLGNELLEPIKTIYDFAKNHETMKIKVGIINGDIADTQTIEEYANIPSMDGLLTMLASGMIEHVRNLAICLDMYANNLEEN